MRTEGTAELRPNDRFKRSTSGFVTYLYEAYVRADSGNARRIEEAFPHFFEGVAVEPETESREQP